jgi:hypothetical protein
MADSLDPVQSALLEVVADVSGANEDAGIDTEQAAQRVVTLLRERSGSFNFSMVSPWFGLQDAAGRLERLDVIEVDPGMAQAVGRSSGASSPDPYVLVTDEGRLTAALEALERHGPIRRDRTRTTDAKGRTIPWFVVTVDVVCGSDTVMVTGEATSEAAALASAFDRALARQATA